MQPEEPPPESHPARPIDERRPGVGPGTGWRVASPILILAAGFAIGIFAGGMSFAFGGSDDDATAIGALVASSTFLGLGWLAYRRLPAYERRSVLTSRGSFWISVLIGLGLALAIRLATGMIVQIGQALDPGVCTALQEISEDSVPSALWHKLALAFAVVVLAPLGEELVFRGLLLRGLVRARKIVFPVAAVISGLVFALAHLQYLRAWPLTLAIAVFGVTAAYLYRWRGYPAAVTMHLVFNTFAAVFLFWDFGLDTTVTCS